MIKFFNDLSRQAVSTAVRIQFGGAEENTKKKMLDLEKLIEFLMKYNIY